MANVGAPPAIENPNSAGQSKGARRAHGNVANSNASARLSGDTERVDGSQDEPPTDSEQQKESEEGQTTGGEEGQSEAPKPVGFWDPSLKHVRREAFMKWCITTSILMAFILAVLSLYWGALSRVNKNLSNLIVYIVDFDGLAAPYNTSGVVPFVGPAITRLATQAVSAQGPNLGYKIKPPSQYNYDPIQVRQAVFDWQAWAAIIVNANASDMLHSAVRNGNTSYDPLGACQLIYQDSRDETTWYDFIAPVLTPFMTQAVTTIGEHWTRSVLQNATSDVSLLRNAAAVPQALSPAIGFSEFNLRPFYPYTTIPAVSVGLIYLIILSFFSFSFYLPIHFKYLKPQGHPPLKFWQLTIWRLCSTVAAYLMLSLAYSFVSMAFSINFYGGNPVHSQTEPTVADNHFLNPDAFGHGTFPVYWMLNFWGMFALGLACENVAMIVGAPWMGLWLIFWVITNVSSAFYDIGIEPQFYQWGYAWPLHYVVQGSRRILFDLRETLPLDFGVLIAWSAVNTALFPFACYFMRWKSQHHVKEYYR